MSLSVECCSSQEGTSGHDKLGREAASMLSLAGGYWMIWPKHTMHALFWTSDTSADQLLDSTPGKGNLTQISWVWKRPFCMAGHWHHNLFTSITQSLKRKWKCEWQTKYSHKAESKITQTPNNVYWAFLSCLFWSRPKMFVFWNDSGHLKTDPHLESDGFNLSLIRFYAFMTIVKR